jgi:hypothetical protein
MPKKYIFVRMHEDTYKRYKQIKDNMEKDIRAFTGKSNLNLHMTNVFKAIVSPEYNERFIQIDLSKLSKLARKKRK